MTDRDNVVPLTRGAVQPTEEMNERLAALRMADLLAIDTPDDHYSRAVKKNHDVSQRIGREADHYAGLQSGEVIERWFDRPSIVAPLLLVMASFMLACVVIVLIAGGS